MAACFHYRLKTRVIDSEDMATDVEDGYVYPSTEIQSEEPQTAQENPIFILEGNNTVVQYLFTLSGPPIPHVVSSTAEWENELRATIGGMLVGAPLGEPRASVIRAPFINDQYAGGYLDFDIHVSWQKCFL